MVFLKDKIRELIGFPHAKIEYPTEATHGDYACAIAFELAKQEKKSPRQAAEELMKKIKRPDWIERIEIAGAGFINFFLSPKFLTAFLAEIKKEATQFGQSDIFRGKTVATDISHPNVAKPMGVHHLLSTIIGDSLNRIFAAVGYKVVRDNYLGDWGTQFGKLIYAYKTWGDEVAVQKNPIPELLELYVKFHDEAERDPNLEDLGRLEFKKLEQGDAENRKLWKWVVDLSLKEFHKIWNRLDVKFDFIHGESFYEDKMQAIIDCGIKEKIFVEGERGALIAPLDDANKPPCIIRKSDGATTYATRDLARVKYWEDEWHPDLMVMVVDMAQILHFQQFIEVAEKLKLTKAQNIHIPFGRMQFPEKRMSTRKGNIVLLEELLDEAQEGAYKIVCEKNPELSDKQKRAVARQVGIGSVKYAVLAQNRMTNVTFTWEKMLSLEGNSAPYVQYVHARACSILRKQDGKKIVSKQEYILKEPSELAVARLLPKFPEVVAHAAQEFKPNLIANYLFELASRFNTFYASVQVLQAEEDARAARLALTESVATTLKNGLALLGIEAPEEM
ncbi:arginine--tRNA ligase [Candidatus Peregrinibacteria bacterium]|nr:arginine--tRNA ligase [Candidatus Peregrinibacteria bacterium]